jgi:replicative superfamily II helicase
MDYRRFVAIYMLYDSKLLFNFFQERGVTDLYEWQKEILQLPALNGGQNVIYSAPTSGGKTLVAEICLIHTVQVLKK